MIQKNNFLSVYIPKQSELFENEPQNSAGKDKQVNVFNGKLDRYAVIEASAGTGKTFALVELVLELVLEQEIPLKSILLVTFTEKATEFSVNTKSLTKFNSTILFFKSGS